MSLSGFCLLSLVLWIIIIARSKCIKSRTVDEYESVYDGILFNNDQQNSILGKHAIHTRDTDIWSHYYRMYLIGENSISYPWYMPKDFPNDALSDIPKDRFLYFIKKE